MKRNKRLKTEYEDGVHFVVAVSAKVKKNKKTKKGAVNGKTKASPPQNIHPLRSRSRSMLIGCMEVGT